MNTTIPSGLCKAPDIPELHDDSPLWDKNVYFIEPYDPGFSIFAKLGTGTDVKLQLANWDGTPIEELDQLHMQGLEINEVFIPHASNTGINKYQLFFNSDLAIVDLIGPTGEFVSPGMLQNIFSNAMTIQKMAGQGVLTKDALKKMLSMHDQLFLKPMSKMVIDKDPLRPMYARVRESVASLG